MAVTVDRRVLIDAPRSDLVALAKKLAKLKLEAARVGPQTPDELHDFIFKKWGYWIPRVAVDPDHCAPFDLVRDVFFEDIRVDGQEVSGALVVGGRESAKSLNLGVIHVLNARFKPGYWGISAGAVGPQSQRVYDIIRELNEKWGGDGATSQDNNTDNGVVDSLKSITTYANTSKINVIGSTISQLNGPHSNLLHRDEAELFDRDAFAEGDNITKSGKTTDGRVIKAIDVITSSLKFAKGLLQELIADHDEAISKGGIPRYKVYKWGIAETIAPVKNCRYVCGLEVPEQDKCPCNRVIKGKMPDGTDRTLEKICNGRFARSDGWRPLVPDVIGKFLSNSPGMWESQQESRKAAAEGLILPNYSPQTHGIASWTPDPERGEIYNSNDIGATHASCSLWAQYTERAYSAQGVGADGNPDGRWVVIPKDSYVFFDEVYVSDVGNNVFAGYIKAHEADWRRDVDHWEVIERYIDIAAKSQKLDFKNTHDLPTVWRLPSREVEPQIDKIVEAVDSGRFFVVVSRCPNLDGEAQAWQRDPKTGKPIERYDDAMASTRYLLSNVDRKLISEGRHPEQLALKRITDSGPEVTDHAASDPTKTAPGLDKDPETGPAFSDYMRGSPHDHEELMPIHAHLEPDYHERQMGWRR